MLSRKQTYKPEEDFEIQFQRLIDDIQTFELLELPFGFERQFFNYLYANRPKEINLSSLLKYAALEINSTTFDEFKSLIGLLSAFITSPPSKSNAGILYSLPAVDLDSEQNLASYSKYFKTENDFYFSLISKLEKDLELRKKLKKDKKLSKKIIQILSEINLTDDQIAEIKRYLR